uniref:Uncharacterized protein n=1 Tax=Tetranychus urticae TaxID=32264 RepID=T1KBV9_TETUR
MMLKTLKMTKKLQSTGLSSDHQAQSPTKRPLFYILSKPANLITKESPL